MSTPTTERPAFRIVIPAAKVDDGLIADLVGPMWKLALTRLYLLAGMYIPHQAKVVGSTRFGFCDSDGEQQPRAQATHFGWTAPR